MRYIYLTLSFLIFLTKFGSAQTKNGKMESYNLSFLNTSNYQTKLNLNYLENNSNSCKNVDPSQSTNCYFSYNVVPKLEKVKLSGLFGLGEVERYTGSNSFLDQKYELNIGYSLNIQYISITGKDGDTSVDGTQFPGIGIDLWFMDNRAFTIFGIKPLIGINATYTPYSPFIVVGKNSAGTEKFVRGYAQLKEGRGVIGLRFGGRKSSKFYRYFQLNYEKILQSELLFKGEVNNLEGFFYSIEYVKYIFWFF